MTRGTKNDAGKLPMDLLDPEWLEGVAAVLQFGAMVQTVGITENCKHSAHPLM